MIFFLQVESFKITDFVVESSPEDVKAELQLEATISASTKRLSVEGSKELFAFGIPEAGFAVANLFELGATISYSVGVSAAFSGQGVVDFGLAASLPNSAKVTADWENDGGNSAVGFQEATFDPLFDVKSLSATVELVAFSKAKIAFGIDVTKIGKLDVAVTLQVPKVTTTVTAAFGENSTTFRIELISANTKNLSDEKGVCSTDPGSSKTGIKLDSQIALEVDLDLDANLGSGGTPAKTFTPFVRLVHFFHLPLSTFCWLNTVWQIQKNSKDLFSKCFPFDIPGLKPTVVATSSLSVLPIAPPTSTLTPLPAGPAAATVTGVPIPLPTGVVGSGSLPPLQPSGGPVPSVLMPRGSFRGPYYPIRA